MNNEAPRASCPHSCGPGDYRHGGKCWWMGCLDTKPDPVAMAKALRTAMMMRHWQRHYFATRSPEALKASKDMERAFDRLAADLAAPPDLFGLHGG